MALFVLGVLCVLFAGCDNSSGPTATDFSEGSGYRIKLAVTNDTLVPGATTIVTATVLDETGQPAADAEDAVSFAFADKGATWDGLTNNKADLKGGVAMANLTWEDSSTGDNPDNSRVAWVTASYRGAVAMIQISLVSVSF